MRRQQQRVLRHLCLGALTVAISGLCLAWLPEKSPLPRLSTGLAFAALLWLACTLSVGPYQVLRGRAHPPSQNLRRDLGIWSAISGLLHTAAGFHVHAGGNYRYYFIPRPDRMSEFPIRTDLGGLANFAGLAAAFVLVVLLAISSDRALERLGPNRWKGLQRWTYALALLTVFHGAAYQISGERGAPLVGVLIVLSAAPAALQWLGFLRIRSLSRQP